MEKLLIMCEGSNEKTVIDILIRNDCLKFTTLIKRESPRF